MRVAATAPRGARQGGAAVRVRAKLEVGDKVKVGGIHGRRLRCHWLILLILSLPPTIAHLPVSSRDERHLLAIVAIVYGGSPSPRQSPMIEEPVRGGVGALLSHAPSLSLPLPSAS